VTAPAYQQLRFTGHAIATQMEYNKNWDARWKKLSPQSSPRSGRDNAAHVKRSTSGHTGAHQCCRGERELHFEGEVREGKRVKAWDQLCGHLRVSSRDRAEG